jgi:hypothetical protein
VYRANPNRKTTACLTVKNPAGKTNRIQNIDLFYSVLQSRFGSKMWDSAGLRAQSSRAEIVK